MNSLKTIVVGSLEVNCYVLFSGKDALIIDPGADAEIIKSFLGKNNLSAEFIIHTHGHFDHIGADNEFEIPIYIHSLDRGCLLDSSKNLSMFVEGKNFSVKSKILTLRDKDKISCGDINLEVIHTPGHTKGGVCLLWEGQKCIFTGDTLFYEGVGRADFPGASFDELISSIKEKLFVLDDDFICYPGHGSKTSIGYEKKNNPFLR